MKQTQFTPGPWEVRDNYRKQDETVLYKAGPCFGVYSNGFNGDGNGHVWVEQAGEIESVANAYLIAAAPDLLVACEALLAHITEPHTFSGQELEIVIRRSRGALHKARAALAKVTP